RRKNLEANIVIAQSELNRRKDRLDWTEQLAEKGYATRTELEADRLEVARRELELSQAQEALRLVLTYEGPMQVRRLEAEKIKAEQELSKAQRQAESELIQAQADLSAQVKTLE